MRILLIYILITFQVHWTFAQDFRQQIGVRSWRVPNFSNQETALGYGLDVFSTPKGMEKQVQFWIDIYTKYSSNEAVIHDNEYIDLIYRVVDLSSIDSEKQRQKKVDQIKKEIIQELKHLSTVTSIDQLQDEEQKRIWNYFSSVNKPNKFKEAAQMDRIRYQSGQKDHMQQAIFLSGRYLEQMEQVFKEEGIPIEITRLVFVESSFNVFARSKVGASGLWQLMPSVARPYGYIKSVVDKRNNPIDATKLAAKILKNNFNLLGTWPLAITGYNHGPNGIKRIMDKHKTDSLPELIEAHSSSTFKFASKNFYASFLAALAVERNAPRYFSNPLWSNTLKAVEYKVPKIMTYKELASIFENDEMIQVYNPHLSSNVRKGKQKISTGTIVYLPEDKLEKMAQFINPDQKNQKQSQSPQVERDVASTNKKPTETDRASSAAVGSQLKAE